jgi:hypothetical protein
MLSQVETRSLVAIVPSEAATTLIEPFTDRELSALDTVMHIEGNTVDHNLMLQHASASYAGHPNNPLELHEAMYLSHHNVLTEIATGWYAFTALGIERAKATEYAS